MAWVLQAVKMDGANTHMESLDCLRFLDGSRLASKSADGRLIISDFQQRSQLLSWKVRTPLHNACRRCTLVVKTSLGPFGGC